MPGPIACRAWVFAATVAAALLCSGTGAAIAGERTYTRLPVMPALSRNATPELCEGFRAALELQFRSSTLEVSAQEWLAEQDPVEFPEPVPLVEGDKALLRAIEARLDSSGAAELLVSFAEPFNWRFDSNSAYVFPDRASLDAWRKAVAVHKPFGRYLDRIAAEHGGREIHPRGTLADGTEVGTGDGYVPLAAFRWRGGIYLLDEANPDLRAWETDSGLFRVRARGVIEEVCRVTAPGEGAAISRLVERPAVATFMRLVAEIGDAGAEDGTLHVAYRHNKFGERVTFALAYRPWLLADEAAGDEPESGTLLSPDAGRFLTWWSEEELWNQRQFDTLRASLEPARDALAEHLVAEFGVERRRARPLATAMIRGAVDSWLTIPSAFLTEGPTWLGPETLASGLRRAVLRRDRARLDALLESAKPASPETREAASVALRDAVEWPYAVARLLAAGADPDAGNGDAKTALMMAAHFNRLDTVNLLLASGAQVNPPAGRALVRNALDYAAENASPQLIHTLVAKGARSSGFRTENGEARIDANSWLTAEQRAAGLAALAENATPPAAPSFACEGARGSIERAICSDDVLSQFDAGMALHYARVSAQEGMRNEQRAWLTSLRSKCAAADQDCLAREYRTRIRYLKYREYASDPLERLPERRDR